MFPEVFKWLLFTCFPQIFHSLKQFKLSDNMSYFGFLIILAGFSILYSFLCLVRKDTEEERSFIRSMDRLERYREKKKMEKSKNFRRSQSLDKDTKKKGE